MSSGFLEEEWFIEDALGRRDHHFHPVLSGCVKHILQELEHSIGAFPEESIAFLLAAAEAIWPYGVSETLKHQVRPFIQIHIVEDFECTEASNKWHSGLPSSITLPQAMPAPSLHW